jgi:hypothetical protein
MAEGISLLDLPPAAIGEIEGGNFSYMVTPDGQPYKVDISQLVAKMQADAGCVCINTAKVDIPTAEVLNLNTTPKAFGLVVPTGFYVQLLSAQMKATYNSATYATNTGLEVGFAGVKPVFLDSVLGFNSSTFVNLDYNNSGAVSAASDVIVSVNNGNPTAGNSDITVYITYALIEL